MTFYDYDRIRYKNLKYVTRKAYEIVHNLESMGYEGIDIGAEIEKQLVNAKTETQQDILKKAMELAKESKKESEGEEEVFVKSFDYVDGRVKPATPSK